MWKPTTTTTAARGLALLVGGLLLPGLELAAPCRAASRVSTMSPHAQQLFNASMGWLDGYWDADAGYLYDVEGGNALDHETRSSAWYALGLLARDDDDDVRDAERILANVAAGQFASNASAQWYGDYQKYPEEPTVGSAHYPPSIYNSWDPNWRGFVGTTLVVALEEFGHLLSNATREAVLESLRLSAVGDSYRVGGLDGDNLYPSYSNPAIMRAFVAGWTGRQLGDANMTQSGEAYAQEIIDLFTRSNTLSEFNSGTYTGVSLFGLLLWSKYMPEDSVMAEYGPKMLTATWEAIAQLWHPGLKNMAGPWDRAYGYDMNRCIMALWFWTLIGREASSVKANPQIMSHSADYAWAPVIAVLAADHAALLPDGLVGNLTRFGDDEERTFAAQAYYPPYDLAARNITTWLSRNLTIGAESFDENVLGGPSESQTSFNPAVVQWDTGAGIGFLSLYPTETAVQVAVAPGSLDLTYPRGNASSVFTLVVSTFKQRPTLAGWADVPGVNVSVSGNADMNYTLAFGGEYGGDVEPISDFDIWNFTYTMKEDFQGTPHLRLEFAM
ncbi:hypothetical protein GGR56DRAFT_666165 [Xylariaceae sp. FL0804]|nr:hypothetical protein GGR56DRAFT_666165 [Xylariaceae sp. FL0804]